MDTIVKELSPLEFKFLAINRLRWFAQLYKIMLETDDNFVKREPTPLLSYETLDDIAADIKNYFTAILGLDPGSQELTEKCQNYSDTFVSGSSDPFDLIKSFYALLHTQKEWMPNSIRLEKDAVAISVTTDDISFKIISDSEEFEELTKIKYHEHRNIDFLSEVMKMSEKNRKEGLLPTVEESSLVHFAQQSVAKGDFLPKYYQSLGVGGFRKIQTYLSVADPGEGHVSVTASAPELLEGVVVHVEHIDRDRNANKDIVEPYRLPAALNAAKVRIAVASEAPVTAFIGRPMFENFDLDSQLDPHFDLDLLKTSHYTASACSTMFLLGMADCKVGIERMTYNQAVLFMKAVVGNVIRDENLQYLSAAFNINTSIKDDRKGEITEISDPWEVAQMGLQIAIEGGFEKVTWDGASNQIPSVPIINQLSHAQFVELIHRAHENGLETYISAGLNDSHMAACVNTGVDGVGIGTSLHYRDPETKLMGALKPEAILKVLETRDQAAESVVGRGAKLLARMDREFYEKTLKVSDNKVRFELCEALKEKDENKISQILSRRQANDSSKEFDLQHPLLGMAERVTSAVDSILQSELGDEKFSALKSKVGKAAKKKDFQQLKELLKK